MIYYNNNNQNAAWASRVQNIESTTKTNTKICTNSGYTNYFSYICHKFDINVLYKAITKV